MKKIATNCNLFVQPEHVAKNLLSGTKKTEIILRCYLYSYTNRNCNRSKGQAFNYNHYSYNAEYQMQKEIFDSGITSMEFFIFLNAGGAIVNWPKNSCFILLGNFLTNHSSCTMHIGRCFNCNLHHQVFHFQHSVNLKQLPIAIMEQVGSQNEVSAVIPYCLLHDFSLTK